VRGLFVTGVEQTAIMDLPVPEPGPYEALVQVLACGICNSTDWKIIEGEFVSGSFPILLGHESVGRVIRVGAQVRSFKEGDLVLRSRLRDEHVPVPGGRSCWGGFVEQALVSDVWAERGAAYNAFPHPQQIVPSGIPPAQAVALITLKETLSCLRNSDVQPGQSLAIVGTGPVAQALTFFADLSDIHPLVVFGRRAAWADRLARLGADAYVAGAPDDPGTSPLARQILESGGFDRAIEAVGSRSALARCLEVVEAQGRVNLYGIAAETEPYLAAHESDPRVFRAPVAEENVHDELIAWIEQDRVDLADWISHVLPWEDYQRGFDIVANKTAGGRPAAASRLGPKVVLEFA
jgi:threonine dehydrogenase-like Zn-dependent dehydrogenase